MDLPTVSVALLMLAVLWKWRIPKPLVVLVAAALGLVLYPHVRG